LKGDSSVLLQVEREKEEEKRFSLKSGGVNEKAIRELSQQWFSNLSSLPRLSTKV
jgi:hypothetical protein